MQQVDSDTVARIQRAVLEQVRDIQFHHFTGTAKTVCCLVFDGGYAVTGVSATALEKFDPEKGKIFALNNAVQEAWSREAYRPRDPDLVVKTVMELSKERAR